MLFTTLLSTVSVLAAGAHAGTIKRQDPHIVDFRTWGQSACSEDNQGIWTFTASQLTGCKSFSSFGGGNVQSLSLVDIAEGCSLTLYDDEACSGDGIRPPAGACYSPASGSKSFLLAC